MQKEADEKNRITLKYNDSLKDQKWNIKVKAKQVANNALKDEKESFVLKLFMDRETIGREQMREHECK